MTGLRRVTVLSRALPLELCKDGVDILRVVHPPPRATPILLLLPLRPRLLHHRVREPHVGHARQPVPRHRLHRRHADAPPRLRHMVNLRIALEKHER